MRQGSIHGKVPVAEKEGMRSNMPTLLLKVTSTTRTNNLAISHVLNRVTAQSAEEALFTRILKTCAGAPSIAQRSDNNTNHVRFSVTGQGINYLEDDSGVRTGNYKVSPKPPPHHVQTLHTGYFNHLVSLPIGISWYQGLLLSVSLGVCSSRYRYLLLSVSLAIVSLVIDLLLPVCLATGTSC